MKFIEIGTVAYSEFIDYLIQHEEDIALEINDFGSLRKIFREVLGRQADH